MPSIRYANQSAPFWDFIAGLENQGAQHPIFGRAGAEDSNGEINDEEGAWAGGWGGPWGWSNRGWHGGHPGAFPHRPPPPPGPHEHDNEKSPAGDADQPEGPDDSSQAPHGGPSHEGPHPYHHHRGRHGPHGEHRRGRCGGRGGFGRGGFGRGGPWAQRGMPFTMGALSDFIQSQMFGENAEGNNDRAEDFRPEVDVFDTEAAFVVHVSLPGAKKEDVAVNWDAEKSELSIAGVTYRPGDEDFLKTLALDERSIGAFERKVRLGSRANPAAVDADAISARLEDGVLIVTVPKEDKDFVEVKKIDIE